MGLYGDTIKELTPTETSDGMGGVSIEYVATPIPCSLSHLTVEISRQIFGADLNNAYILRSPIRYDNGQEFEVDGEVYRVKKILKNRRKILYVLEGV